MTVLDDYPMTVLDDYPMTVLDNYPMTVLDVGPTVNHFIRCLACPDPVCGWIERIFGV